MKLYFESTENTKYVVHPRKLDMDLYDIVFNDDHSHAGDRASSNRFESEEEAWKYIRRTAQNYNWLV